MGSKRTAKCERSWDVVERRVDCRDCSRLPEKKTRIRGETFEDKKKKGDGGEIVVIARWRLPAERESTRVQERKEKGGIR